MERIWGDTLTLNRPVNLPALKIETKEEQRIFDLGQKKYEAKKKLAKTGLRKANPTLEESNLIHKMWLEGLAYLSLSPLSPSHPFSSPLPVSVARSSC